jgi:hypothetical protein
LSFGIAVNNLTGGVPNGECRIKQNSGASRTNC